MCTPGQTRAPRSSSQRAPMSAPSPITPPRNDPPPDPDYRAFNHAADLDPHAVEDDRTVQPRAGADLSATSDDSAADEQRAGRHRGAVVHQLLAAMATQCR